MKCWVCGKEATKRRGIGTKDVAFLGVNPFEDYNQRCYCEKCFAEVMAERARDMSEYVRLRKKVMFERAVDILEHQNLDLYDYKEAIEAVREFAEERPDKFDSSYEMIAAIILVENEIGCKLQHPVGKYQVDFYIPEKRVVLEIDGERHKHRKSRDSERDRDIKAILGAGWQIVRIKTEYLDKQADMLVEAIDAVIRQRNAGLL